MALTGIALVLFLLSAALFAAVTVCESVLAGLSSGAERLLTFLLLVLPSATGAALGAMSLMRKEGRAWLGIALLVLNALFALFHLMIVMFAG